MKISKETPTLMEIEDKRLAGYFVGAIFMLAGIAIIIYPALFKNNPPVWAGISGLLIGLVVILITQTTIITLDKTLNKAAISKKNLIKKENKEYALNQIKAIELQQQVRNSIQQRRQTISQPSYSYQLFFVLVNGERIPLPSSSSGSASAIGSKMSLFLNIPFDERRPPTVNEVLSTVRETVMRNQNEPR